VSGSRGAGLAAIATAILALLAVGLAVERLLAARAGVVAEDVAIGETPATVFRPDAPSGVFGGATPVVVVAHGFAGSRTLMAPFAVALAKNGYVAITFDFLGHGSHPLPLPGDVTTESGATRHLVEQTQRVMTRARTLGGDELALLGHSMASDIVVRAAKAAPDVRATVAVSMFSPAVTAREPRNLLVIVGAWETGLRAEALRAVGLATGEDAAREGETYGRFDEGTARRAVFADSTEHVAVLFSEESLREAVSWLDAAFGADRGAPVVTAPRLPWIGLLVLGILLLAVPLSRLLPRVCAPPAGASLGWGGLAPAVALPTLATPLLLRLAPTDILPIVVGDYLAIHLFTFGALTAGALAVLHARRKRPAAPAPAPASTRVRTRALVLATVAVTLYAAGALGLAVEGAVTNYHPNGPRAGLLALLLPGTLACFLSAGWATRGADARRGAPFVLALGLLLSLALAVALDFERLFFLAIIVPVIVPFFAIYGFFGQLSYRRTGHPVPGAVASAVAFAWAIAVTFPMLAG